MTSPAAFYALDPSQGQVIDQRKFGEDEIDRTYSVPADSVSCALSIRWKPWFKAALMIALIGLRLGIIRPTHSRTAEQRVANWLTDHCAIITAPTINAPSKAGGGVNL